MNRTLTFPTLGMALSLLAACAGPAPAPQAASSIPTTVAIDYDRPEHWLCRPGRQDTCTQPLALTTVPAEGPRSTGATLAADPNAPIDCFYVYPTVSNDPMPNSDLQAGPEERSVAFAQLSPFRTRCRLFAPMYRQVTLAALRSRFTGTPMVSDWSLGYRDVRAAWQHYLAHDNRGRGVVLIGHSQGARVLTELVAKEIEGRPVQRQLISVMTLGSNLLVPKGRDVGGSFQSTPLCRSARQVGCAISYVSFRADAPPPATSLFGRAVGEQVVACTNPAALAGGDGVPQAWFSKRSDVSAATGVGTPSWQVLVGSVDTPFFSVPGLLATRCVQDAHGSYLAVQVRGDRRADDIGGDVVVGGQVVRDWGLHLLDASVGMGDLLEIVGQQTQAYLARGQ